MMTKRIPGLSAVLAALPAAGCGPAERQEPPAPRPVYTVEVKEPQPLVERSFSGLVEAAEGAGLAFEVTGRVVEVGAREGERYEQAATLARLDPTEFQNQLSAARAQLTEAEQSLRRSQQLFETGNAAQGQLESAIAQEKAARSNFNTVQKRLNDAVLRMPYPGIIGEVTIDAGQVVNAGQQVMMILGEEGMEFEIGVPSEMIGQIRAGQEGSIILGSFPNRTFPGRVTTISPQPGQNTTYPVVIAFQETDPGMREGMDGEARLELPNPAGETVSIPAVCVGAPPGDTRFVWVYEADEEGGAGTVRRRTVETGSLRGRDELEILGGLEPGEIVVSRGVNRLEEGEKVRLFDPALR